MRSNGELLKILKRLNGMPVEDVKEALNSTSLKFDEWQRLTNTDLGSFSTSGSSARAAEGYVDKFRNKTDIGYEEYLKMQHLSVTREFAKQPNIARAAKEMGKSPEEITELEQIEELWNTVRVKYDPVAEIERISDEVSKIVSYGRLEKVDDDYAIVLSDIESLELAIQYTDEAYDKDKKCTFLETDLSSALKEAQYYLKTLKNSQDMSIGEFITELGVEPEEITEFYKGKLKQADKHMSDRPSIMASVGRAFKLNDNGEIEVIDENRAKSQIVSDFQRDVNATTIDGLSEGMQYSKVVNGLPKRTSSISLDEDEDEHGYRDKYDDNYEPKYKDDYDYVYRDKDEHDDGEEFEYDEYEEEKLPEDSSAEEVSTDVDSWLEANSGKSVEDLQQEIESNDRTIAQNDKDLRRQLALRILQQQKEIAEQKKEMTRLKNTRGITNE